MHSVSSNAVADIFSADVDNTKFAFNTNSNTEVTAQCTGICYIIFNQQNTSATDILENDNLLIMNDHYANNSWYRSFTVLIRKGRKYKWRGSGGSIQLQTFIPFNID